MSMKQSPLLSLVVTSYTTERLSDIYELLESINNQTLQNMETIFIIERSEELLDSISAFIEEHAISNIKTVFSGERLGLSMARNLGIEHAKGEIIGFVDDDVVLYPDWAGGVVKALDDNIAIGVTGSAFPLWETESLKWLPEEFYWLISCTAWTGWEERRITRGVFGANMAFRKEAFDDNCMFAPEAGFSRGHRDRPISEDIEFSLRLRKKIKRPIVFDPRPRVWHRVVTRRLSFGYIVQRAHHVGCTRRILRRYYADEFGTFDQERSVLKGIFTLLIKTPKQVFTNPLLVWRKLSLIGTILIAFTVGYFVPLPIYSLKEYEKGFD
jgi:GT2 family glycosyltransferase